MSCFPKAWYHSKVRRIFCPSLKNDFIVLQNKSSSYSKAILAHPAQYTLTRWRQSFYQIIFHYILQNFFFVVSFSDFLWLFFSSSTNTPKLTLAESPKIEKFHSFVALATKEAKIL
ncbi:hypothetical protein CsSME_00039560 [Camellia sinensis var. sinensis]